MQRTEARDLSQIDQIETAKKPFGVKSMEVKNGRFVGELDGAKVVIENMNPDVFGGGWTKLQRPHIGFLGNMNIKEGLCDYRVTVLFLRWHNGPTMVGWNDEFTSMEAQAVYMICQNLRERLEEPGSEIDYRFRIYFKNLEEYVKGHYITRDHSGEF